MSADASGNDIALVGVPVGGLLAVAPVGTAIPTPVEGGKPSFVLPADFKRPGLITEDGGFEWTLESEGDKIVFWHAGFSLSTGLAKAELVVKLAQNSEIVRSITTGKTADANGYLTIDAGGSDARYVVWTEEIFSNGVIRRRVAANAIVLAAKEDKNKRGEVLGLEITFKVDRAYELENNHLGEWLLPSVSTLSVPTAVGAAPLTAVGGAVVTITGTGFAGISQVKFGASGAPLFNVVSATSIEAVMPPGSAGSAAITVTNAAGTSTPLAYMRGA